MPTKTQTAKSGLLIKSQQHKRRLYIIAAVIVLLLAWWIWRKPMARAVDAFLGKNTANISRANLASQPAVATGTTPGSGGSSTTGTQSRNNSTTSTSHDSTTSTTTTTTPGTPTEPPTTPNTPTNPAAPSTLFASITTGQNKDQLISLAGSTPNTCNLIPLLNEEVCTWINNGTAVTATLLNGQVIGKTQVGL